jgi:7-carboxy-7-deazaguanine synthase
MSINEVLEKVEAIGIKLVELTGGEPLAQKVSIPLMQALIDRGYGVLLETSGSEDIKDVPTGVHVIMDLKCPGSGMVDRNLWSNLEHLKKSDEIKFVIADRHDYDWAKSTIAQYDLTNRANVLLSTAFGLLAPKDVVAWMLEDHVQARFQLQQHKYIWHPRAKGV